MLVGIASAQIDSGGGMAQIGAMTNHSSIGESFTTNIYNVGSTLNRTGLVEILYSAGTPTDPDANGNGMPDDWEQQYY
jgi:hypothetical protein